MCARLALIVGKFSLHNLPNLRYPGSLSTSLPTALRLKPNSTALASTRIHIPRRKQTTAAARCTCSITSLFVITSIIMCALTPTAHFYTSAATAKIHTQNLCAHAGFGPNRSVTGQGLTDSPPIHTNKRPSACIRIVFSS